MNKELKEAIKRALITKHRGTCILSVETLETLLNYIDNSISKEVIKEKIEELRNMKVEGEVFTTAVNFTIKFLQELLEQK